MNDVVAADRKPAAHRSDVLDPAQHPGRVGARRHRLVQAVAVAADLERAEQPCRPRRSGEVALARVQLDEPTLTQVVYGEESAETFMCAALSSRRDPDREMNFALELMNETVKGICSGFSERLPRRGCGWLILRRAQDER